MKMDFVDESALEAEEVPEGEVEVASRVVETGVATESVAFLQVTEEGTVALSERVRSAH